MRDITAQNNGRWGGTSQAPTSRTGPMEMLALRVMQGKCALAGFALKSPNRPQRCGAADSDTEQTIEGVASIRYVRAGDDTPLLPVPVLDESDQVQTVGRVCLPNRPDI